MQTRVSERELVIVNTPEEFAKMPKEYQDLAIHQMMAHTEGELTGADDYIEIFYPIAPNAYEKAICCERAAEEVDHYMRGAKCLMDIGVDTSYMLKQHFRERPRYRNEIVRDSKDWVDRGLFSFLGEAAVAEHLLEMQESSYRPYGASFAKIIVDEQVHVAHGHRIVREMCKTDDGRRGVQDALTRFWPAALDLFGRSDSVRSAEYLRWGLRQYSNEEARQRYIAKMRPKLEALGLTVPADTENRKFM
jgi:ring-1,2-phenylacetyl-CoA epoxidase subunit PaaA